MLSTLSWSMAFVIIAGVCLGAWVVVAIVWTVRHRPFRDMDRQARVIFDDLEPEGTRTDFFPKKGPPPSEYLL